MQKLALTVRVVNQRLQTLGKLRQIKACPRLVDEADVKQVNQVHTVYDAERSQLGLTQRHQIKDGKCFYLHGGGNVWIWQKICVTHFFFSEQQAQPCSWASACSIKKNIGPVRITHKLCSLQRRVCARKVASADEQVNIWCEPFSAFAVLGHPQKNSIAADDGIRNIRMFKSRSGALQPLTNKIDGKNHAV